MVFIQSEPQTLSLLLQTDIVCPLSTRRSWQSCRTWWWGWWLRGTTGTAATPEPCPAWAQWTLTCFLSGRITLTQSTKRTHTQSWMLTVEQVSYSLNQFKINYTQACFPEDAPEVKCVISLSRETYVSIRSCFYYLTAFTWTFSRQQHFYLSIIFSQFKCLRKHIWEAENSILCLFLLFFKEDYCNNQLIIKIFAD